MKKLLALLLSAALVGLAANVAQAAEAQATEAKVLKVTGSASVQLPGQSDSVAVTEGMNLPVGSAITTGADGDVEIQPMAGTITSVKKNSTVTLDELSVNKSDSGVVTKQTAQISLKSGNVVSSLDPARKSINNYGVRTAKGVAAARGTIYAVTVNVGGGTSVATMSGTVTLTPVGGGAPIVVDIGTGAIIGADGVPTGGTLAELIATDTSGEMAAAVTEVVNTVAAAVANNTISGVTSTTTTDGGPTTNAVSNSNAAVTLLAAIVKVASQANPAQAATYTSTAVTAITAPTSSVSVGGGDATTAASAVTEAAVQGAVQTLTSRGDSTGATAVAGAVSAAATSAGGGAVNSATINAAAATGSTTGIENASGAPISPPEGTLPISTPITPIDPTVVSPSGGQ